MVRLFPGLVRIPDVAFASWDRFPDRKIPEEPIPSLAPDLVVEVLSESNTGRRWNASEASISMPACDSSGRSIPSRVLSCCLYPRRVGHACLTFADARRWRRPPGFSLELSELFAELDRTADSQGPRRLQETIE